MDGIIFDIKEMSIHDGPGVRITVFLKGCPLRCLWCHNPEGIHREPELLDKKNLCTHCRKCYLPCVHEECRPFQRCVHACPNGCLSIAGTKISSAALADRLRKNIPLLQRMNGGITISGGEPLMQPEFVCELSEKLGTVHKALQTSGYADLSTYQEVVSHFDYIMQDIKIADSALHKKYTGVSNEKILQNIEYLKKSGKAFVFRIPLIPDITDTPENLTAISEIAGIYPVELLRYNVMAGAKYEMLHRNYELSDQPNRKEDFTKYFKNAKME